MRIPLILAACLAAGAAFAQAPRIRWTPMDFPPATTMEVTLQGRQRDLGPVRIFYDFAKMQNWSCAFDNAGGPRSGPSTLSCQAPNKGSTCWRQTGILVDVPGYLRSKSWSFATPASQSRPG